ncbi:MAG: phosphoribosylaminoimidazolesuccinocarboxamide synthase [Longimicrobiales bacterium]
MTATAISRTALPFPLLRRGKVRDVYDVGGDRLLIVATDRISAFDVVLPQPIPLKGYVLTQITAWWLDQLQAADPHHLISVEVGPILEEVPELDASVDVWRGRAMLVNATQPLPIECVVRGYLSGSAWQEYGKHGTLAGEPLATGLTESARLDPPIFSPATKAEEGHDQNITFTEVERTVGPERAAQLRARSLALYAEARRRAEQSGIIIADTKFEFGLHARGQLLLIDEVLTPDSSRFWPSVDYRPGRAQASFDKQPVRDYLETLTRAGDWNKQPPAPELPEQVVHATSERYRQVYERLTGQRLTVPEAR